MLDSYPKDACGQFEREEKSINELAKQLVAGLHVACELNTTPGAKPKSTDTKSPRREVLDQAQAHASYTPLFLGHSRSIPRGMIFDVQPLVKSLYCPIRPPPMDFSILRPLSRETGYHFFEGGWGLGGGGGGVKKFSLKRLQAVGWPIAVTSNAGPMVTQPIAKFQVSGSNLGRSIVVGGAAAMFTRSGLEPPTKWPPASCITIRPLLDFTQKFSPLLGAASLFSLPFVSHIGCFVFSSASPGFGAMLGGVYWPRYGPLWSVMI